jgi:quercetin dioxygenase-like cupin family protein
MKKKLQLFFALISLILINQSYAKDNNSIIVKLLAKTNSSWDGTELPVYPKGKPEISILKITIPPKTALPIHKHPVINAGILLKGELTVVTDNNEILHIKAGDAVVEVVNKWHNGRNEGDEDAEILVFYVGIENTPITIKQTLIK